MNAQEAILKIKALFEDAPAEAPMDAPVETKVELMEYSLEDGTKVMIDKLEVGGKVTMEDGSNAPTGEHELADGTTITIDENAVILKMDAPKEEKPEEVEAEKEKDMKYNELASKFNELLAATQNMQDKYNELEGKVKQGFESVASLIEALSVNPTADPASKPNSFKAYVSTNDIKEQRINKFRNAILNK